MLPNIIRDKLPLTEEAFTQAYLLCQNFFAASKQARIETQLPKGFYIYFLVNPLDGKIFYVGMGKGRRIKDHEMNVRCGKEKNPKKKLIISTIDAAGSQLMEVIFINDLSREDALDIESYLIDLFWFTGLSNMTRGYVSASEQAKLQAKADLLNILSFEDWKKKCDPSPEDQQLYLSCLEALKDIAENGQITKVKCISSLSGNRTYYE